jgi:hypothetical protein
MNILTKFVFLALISSLEVILVHLIVYGTTLKMVSILGWFFRINPKTFYSLRPTLFL